jgi:hypothetical protein
MSNLYTEAIICFENATQAIMAERALVENAFSVRVMPLPSSVRKGCGFCLRFAPDDLARAVAFLAERGFTAMETYAREETPTGTAYTIISLANGGRDGAGF